MKKFIAVAFLLSSVAAIQGQEKVTEGGIVFTEYEMQIVSNKDAIDRIEPPLASTDCDLEDAAIQFTYKDVTFSGGKYGTLERTWTASDGCGNSASTIQYIALRD